VPQSKRSYYRINYPSQEQPRLVIVDGQFRILNLSEEGVLVDMRSKAKSFSPGTELRGTICLACGESHSFRAVVLRQTQGQLALRLEEPVPLPLIMQEQRYLLNKYKTLDEMSS